MNLKSRPSWNRLARRDIALSESNFTIAPDAARRHTLGRRVAMLSLLATALGMTGLAYASGGPTGGQIVGGSGQIQQVGTTTTIHQNSSTLSLNWQSFNIGPDQTVNFVQPGSNAIAINRIFASTPSEIYGHLNANGQVWLINPNGVLFGQSAQVNVGGLVASTLDVDDSTIDSNNRRFSGSGKGSIVNRGSINASNGGYVALIGNQVSNQGVITAQLGTVALGGGSAVTLTFNGNQLLHLQVDRSTLNNLAENRQLIVADGGRVIMTAGAKDALLASVVNNSGRVQAQTVQNHDGTITLLGGMEAGTVNVGGTLDASAPNGGKGGFIETSGAQAHIADGSVITTKAVGGKDGTWLVDPTDFTIAASGGDITASTLESQLANGNVAFTSANGAGGTSGNVNVNQAVTWSANTTLTLTASNNVNLNAAITNTGASGKTVLNAGNAFVNNVGASGLGGNWAIYSASPTATGENLGGLTLGFIQYNAPIGTAAVAGATGNGVFYSVAPTLNVTGLTGTVLKNYDGTTSATLADGNFTYTGMLNGDKISSAAGTYSQSDVGTGLTVTSPSSIAGFTIVNGSNNTPVYGYALSGGSKTASIGQIAAAQLYATIIGDPTKVYDGTTTATLTSANYYITGLAAGQSITVNQPSSVGYASADVNTNGGTTPNGGKVAINATFTSTNFIAGSGTKLSNYILPPNTQITAAALTQDPTAGFGVITPAPVQLSGVLATNKTYNQATNDTLDTSNASIFGVLSTDHVTLDKSNAAGIFASANAGNNIAVTLSGFALVDTVDPNGATKVADYQLIQPGNLTANIAPYVLTVSGITANDKTYDGTTADTLSTGGAQLSAALPGDVVHLTGSATGTFSQSDAGTGLAVAVNGLSVDNSNYTVDAPTGLTANITPRVLDIQFSGSANKIYDGTNYATLSTGNFTVGNVVSGQTVSVNQAPAVYSGTNAPNVGTDTVTATLQSSDLNFTNGAKAGNYTFNTSVVGNGSITPAPLTLVVTGNPTRVYNGASDTSATLATSNFTLSGLIAGQNIQPTGPFTANYYDTTTGGTNPNNPPPSSSYQGNAGTWGVVATLNNSNYVASNGTLLSNYILPTTALGYGTITQANAGVYLVTDINGSKVYDGTNAISITGSSLTNPGSAPQGSAVLVLGGVKSGDTGMALSAALTGYFTSANVGSQPLTVSGLTASDFTCNGCSVNWATNYTFPESVTGTGSIIAKQLYITLNGVTKQYDGNTTVLPLSNSNFTVYGYVNNDVTGTKDSGWVSGEGATITPTASFTYASPNVMRDGSGNVLSNQIGVTGTLTQNNYAATGSTQLSNYNLVYNVSGMGTITPAPLYVTGVYAQNKVYDTTNAATVNIVNGQLAGLADVDKNNTAITLTIGTTSTGSIAGNGAITGSTVNGTFASSNAGNGQVVSTGFSLGGTSAGNYTLMQPGLAANITPAPLTISGIVANNKVYDGTTTATFGAGSSFTFNIQNATLSGFMGADNTNDVTLSATGTTGNFSMANVGSNLSVTGVNGFSLGAGGSGDKSNDYYVVNPTGLTASITPRPLSVTITGNPTKVYDGSTSATLTAGDYTIGAVAGDPNSGWVSGQGATLPQSATASYGSADVKGANLSTVNSTLVSSDWKVNNASTLLSNYILPTSATGTGTITPYVLNLSASRVYDTSTNIYSSISGNVTNANNANVFGTLSGLNGDQFTVSGTGATSLKDVGTYTGTGASGQPTSGQGFNLGTLALVAVGSANAGNYTLVGGADTYTITAAPLNITGATVTSKVYNASTAATVTGATLTKGNAAGDVLGTDIVQVSSGNIAGTFASANANAGLTGTASTPTAVTINSADITGTDAGDYYIVQPTGLAGTINQAPVTISGVRQYNGSATAGVASGTTWTVSGMVGSQTLTVASGSGSSNSVNVGTYTDAAGTFTVSGLTLGNGSNGGLAGNYAIASTGNQFQITPYVINFTGSSTYTGNGTVSIGNGNFFNGSNAVSGTGSFATGIGTETLTLNGPYTLANSGNAGTNTTTVNAASGAGLSFGNGTGTASNYEIGKVTYTVNPYVLSFSGSRSYDGTTNVNASDLRDATTGSGTLGTSTFTGLNGDTFTISGTGSLSSANKGNYGGTASGISGAPSGSTQIGVSGLTLTGTGANAGTELASNYTFVGGNDSYDINAKLVTLSGTRVYDGFTDANGVKTGTNWVINGVTSGDASNLSVAGTGSVSSASVGTYSDNGSTGTNVFTSNVGSGGLSLSGSAAGNYTLETTGNTFTINPYVINLSGSRAYDGTTGAAAGLFTTGGTLAGVGSETLTLSGSGTVSSKNVGTYTGTSQFNLNTLTLGNGSGTASNYTLVGGTDTLAINKAVINLSGTRQYDGNTDAKASAFGSNGVISTGVNGETLNVTGAGTASGANVGNNYAVTPGTLALNNGSGSASNYTLVGGSDTLNITPYVITLNGTRQYDAGTDANAGAFGNNGVINTGVGSETLTVTGAGSVTGQNVGSYTQAGTTFNLGSLALTSDSGQASNYQLSTSNTFAITPYVLNLTGSRAYDGTTGAAAGLFTTGGTLAGVGSETLTLSGSGIVSSKNVGTYTGTSQFNLNTLTLGNGSGTASNYTLVGGTDTLAINKAVINLSGTRQYDGNTDAGASAFGPGGVINTGIGGETLTVTGTGTASGANVGNNYTVTPGTLALTNGSGSASNYTLVGGSDTLNITPYVITLNGTRQYDGGTDANASAFGNNGVINTGVGSETLTVTGAGSVTNQNVGSYTQAGTTFNLGSLALASDSGQASNYQLGTSNTFAITPYVLNLTGSRAYDGTTGAAAGLFTTGGTLAGVGSETLTLNGSGTVSSKNAGTYTGTSQFNLNTLTLGNGSGTASNYTLVGGTDTLTINKALIDINGTRQYDGLVDANASAFGNNGVINTGIGGETLTVTGVGTVSGSNVGTQSVASIGSLALNDNSGLASNYTLAGGSLAITPYIISLTGARAYDGTTGANANLFGNNGVLTGVNNETLTLSGAGTVSGANASTTAYTGTGATTGSQNFNLNTLQLNNGSGSASNYTLIGGADSLTINKAVINLSGTRQYDAGVDANASTFGNNGVINTGVGTETLTVTGTGTVSGANVGTQSIASVGSLALIDGSGSASNYTLGGGSLAITPYVLSLTGSRAYDGTTGANASLFGNSGVLTGVNGETLTLGGAGTVASANASTTAYTGIGATTGSQGFNLSSLTLTGIGSTQASNYTLIGGTDSLTINKAVINLSGTRQYDAGVDANANTFGNNGLISTGVGSETLTVTGAGTVSGANVGGYTVTPGTLALIDGSGSASNYTLVNGSDTLAITPYVLGLTGSRAYDSTTGANANLFGNSGVLTGVNGETLTLSGAGTVASANANASPYTGVGAVTGSQGFNLNSLALSGNGAALASNYTLVGGADALTINPAVVNLNGARVYDATTNADASAFGNNGVISTGVNGETVTLTGTGTVSSKNVGSYTGTDFSRGTFALTDGSGLAGNYTLVGGTDTLAISKATLTVIDTVAGNKTYDGNTNAALTGATLNGVFAGDNVTLGNDSTGTFASPNAGSNIGVSTAMTIGGVDSGNYILQQPTNLAATINPYVLNLIGTRVYDGLTDANASLFGSNGVLSTGIGTETVNLSGSGVLASKHVGTRGFTNLGTLVLSDGTGWASNYTLVGGTDQVTITPRNIVVDATGHDKTYDGNTTAGVTLGSNGVLAGDVVNFDDGAANFSTPNAGSNVSIAVTGITASGADAGDYAFNGNAATSATINPYVLNLTSTRVYDGTTGAAAGLFGNNGVLTGVNGETVDLAGTGVLTSKNVGSQRAFAKLGSLVLGNGTGLASNYTLAGGSDWVSITPATLTVVGTTTTNRVYDGTRVDALNGSTLSGVFGNDDVVLGNDSTGLFVDKNVGNGKAVATAMTISGSDVGNYILMQPTGLFANITPMPIVVTATGTNRMYNGKTDDVISLSTNGVLAGDQVGLVNTSAQFADPYVGNDKTVTVSGIAAVGADAANYLIVDPTTTATANITSAGFNGSGVQGSWIAQLQAGLEPEAIATPYGSSDSDTVGVYTGNHQLKHRPIERNRAHSDFHPGLSLHFQNGGVRLPADASP